MVFFLTQICEHKCFCLPQIPVATVRWLNYNWVMHVLSFSRVFLQDPARIKIDVPLETEWYRWCSFIAVSKYQMPNCSFDKARRYKGLNITSWWNVSEWWIPVTNIPKCSLFKHFFYNHGRGNSISRKLSTGERTWMLPWKSMCTLTNLLNLEEGMTHWQLVKSVFLQNTCYKVESENVMLNL